MLSAPNSGCPQGKRICLLVQSRNPFLAGHVWSPGFFWWPCNWFLSFCLGQDWNPSSFNTSSNSAGELHGSTLAVDHPNQLLTHALLCLEPKATQQMGFYWVCPGPLSAVSMSGQTAVPGPLRWPLLCTLWCVPITHSHPKVSVQTTHLRMMPSPWHLCFPGTKWSQWHLTTPDQSQIQTSNLIIGCMSH